MNQNKPYDVIIIGGSYSGLAAAMALGRALRRVLVIDSHDPCNKQTPYSHNFLTHDGHPPHEIRMQALHEVAQYTTVELIDAVATTVQRTTSGYAVSTDSGHTYTAGRLVLATGIRDLMPPIPGIAESWGISVLHCPYCHGYEVRGHETGILANGDSGYEFAMLISNWTTRLTLYTNGPSTLTTEQAARLQAHHIQVCEATIERLVHEAGYISGIVTTDGATLPATALYARLPFEQHSDIAQQLGCALTPEGYIQTDAAQQTTVPGVYACGDNASRIRTVASAVAAGTTTGIMLNKDLITATF